MGLIDAQEYREDVELAVMFLEGKSQAVLDTFKRKMDAAAASLEYERAASLRDQITHLRKVQESQYVHGEGGDVDIFGLATQSGSNCIQAMFIRNGRMLGQRAFYPKTNWNSRRKNCWKHFFLNTTWRAKAATSRRLWLPLTWVRIALCWRKR